MQNKRENKFSHAFPFRKKRGMEMSFAWLFGIIIGIVILFFAIFVVTKLISQGDSLQTAKTSKEIGILLNPLETSFEDSKTSSFTMPIDTRIFTFCDSETGTFGRQLISVSQKSFNKWTETDLNVTFRNKFIFAEHGIEGKKFFVFSKPFKFPFKVTDLVYMTSANTNYCFKNANTDIERELKNLNQENIFTDQADFPEKCVSVCFGSGTCNITVNVGGSFVEKNRERLYFEGEALMFAAIFTDKMNYECEVKRLMLRTKELSQIYEEKSKIVAVANCNSNLNLVGFISELNTIEDSSNLAGISLFVQEIEDENDRAECKLW